MDAHQKRIIGLAALANAAVQVEKSEDGYLMVICLFQAASQWDAVLMANGLVLPTVPASSITQVSEKVRCLS